MSDISTVTDALKLIKSRIIETPDFGIYKSILRQLEYILSVLDGRETNRDNMEKIIVGHYAVHEFEESDPELASLLKKCQYIAFKLK